MSILFVSSASFPKILPERGGRTAASEAVSALDTAQKTPAVQVWAAGEGILPREHAAEGPLVVAAGVLRGLLLILLELVAALSLGVLLIEGDGQGELLLIPDDGQLGGVPRPVVGGQGGGEGGGGVDGSAVDGGDDVAGLEAGLLGAGALGHILHRGPGGDVTIPEGVKEIGPDVFCGRRLQSVTIPKSVREISSYAFGESSLQSVTIPKSVRSIGMSAFRDCENLTSVTFQDREDASGIELDIFYNCPNITNVAIPRCVARIAHVLFENTLWLKKLGEFAVVDHVLIKYQGRETNVVIPEEIEELGRYSFAYCKSVKRVTIPESVEEIDKSVFEDSRPAIIAPHIPIDDFAPKNKPGACAGFAKAYLDGAELDEEIKAGYLKYIKGQRKRLFPVAIQHEELLRLMFAEKMIVRKDIDPLLAECDKQNNIAAKAAVLDYAHQFDPADTSKTYKL